MTTTTTTAPRFALDEDRAAEYVTRTPADHKPGDVACERWTRLLVHHAVDEGIIIDPLHDGERETLAWEFTGGATYDDGDGYRWLLHVTTVPNPDDYMTLASPAADMALLADGRTGPGAALEVLREAVLAGNVMAGELARYVAALPLAARAPEVAGMFMPDGTLSPAAVHEYLRQHGEPTVIAGESEGCTCCQMHTWIGRNPDDECPKCGHQFKRHNGGEV